MQNFASKCVLALCTITFISCSSPATEPTQLFNTKEKLMGKALSIPSGTLNAPLQMIALDSILVFLDRIKMNGDNYLFRAINGRTGEVVSTFGRVGKGPDEFLFPSFLSKVPGSSGHIGVYNARLFSFSELSIDSIIVGANRITVNSYDQLNPRFSKVIKVSKESIAGTGFFQGGRYALSDTSGNIISVNGMYPFKEQFEMPNRALGMAFQSKLGLHPQNPLLISATSASANLEILELDNGQLESLKRVNSYPPAFKDNSSDNSLSISYLSKNRWGYQDISVSENYIYTLFSGKSMEDTFQYTNKVLVFGWKGEPIIQYNLDREVSHLSVSQDDEMLYGISLDEENKVQIAAFPLSI